MSETNTTVPAVETTPVNETLPTSTPAAAEKPMNKKAKRQAKQAAKKAASSASSTATPTKKASKKAPVKKAPKKAPVKKAAAKASSAKPVKKAAGDVRWSDRRIAVIKAMRQLHADDSNSAKTASEIAAKASKFSSEFAETDDYYGHGPKGVYMVKIHLDQYRKNELLATGYAKSIKHEGERELRYYLTSKGQTTDFSKS